MTHKVVSAVREREARKRRAAVVALAAPRKGKAVKAVVVVEPVSTPKRKKKVEADVQPESLIASVTEADPVDAVVEGPEPIEVYTG